MSRYDFGLSISIRRQMLRFINAGSCSIPRNLRLHRFAAIPVVELPANGSNIHAFFSVEANIMRDNSCSGFWVGCFPHDFSHQAIAGIRHTSVICLLPFMVFMRL